MKSAPLFFDSITELNHNQVSPMELDSGNEYEDLLSEGNEEFGNEYEEEFGDNEDDEEDLSEGLDEDNEDEFGDDEDEFGDDNEDEDAKVLSTLKIDLLVILKEDEQPLVIQFDVNYLTFDGLETGIKQITNQFEFFYKTFWEERLKKGAKDMNALRKIIENEIENNPDDEADDLDQGPIPDHIMKLGVSKLFPENDDEFQNIGALLEYTNDAMEFFDNGNSINFDDELTYPEVVRIYLPGTYGIGDAENEAASPPGLLEIYELIRHYEYETTNGGQIPWVIEMDFVNDVPPSSSGEVWRDFYIAFRLHGIHDFFNNGRFPKRYILVEEKQNQTLDLNRDQERMVIALRQKHEEDEEDYYENSAPSPFAPPSPFVRLSNELIERFKEYL
jgi:hypothetical protein